MDRNSLQGPLLRSVSRSFFLSLRFLPKPLRDPLSLAYLLARATDTIADTPEPPVSLRAEALHNLAAAIQGTAPAENAAQLRESFAPLQSEDGERKLIEQLPGLLEWLDDLAPIDRADVRDVLVKINRGQLLDLERFGAAGEIVAPGDAAQLDEYTYLVAGCVGEFWTRLCFRHVNNFSDQPETKMAELGVRYGQGLQLINILRDAGNDLRNGRCYFPAEELESLGVTPAAVLSDPARIEPVLNKWRAKADRGIEAGIEYACAIRSRRVRFATALPALIGARTLVLLREAGPEALTKKIKIPRAEVRSLIASTAVASPAGLRKRFDSYRK
ncbi:MAG TPA: phytoene/squalene synthase family protein [Chthoniobacterales bacterium]|nr:phytoene/squalene synthase family protein [Chthoniobacterales bacterium]